MEAIYKWIYKYHFQIKLTKLKFFFEFYECLSLVLAIPTSVILYHPQLIPLKPSIVPINPLPRPPFMFSGRELLNLIKMSYILTGDRLLTGAQTTFQQLHHQ